MKRGVSIDTMELGVKHHGLKATIASVLGEIWNDYKNNKVIERLSEKYGKDLSPAYIRKIIGSEVILRMTKSKKDMYYKWNGGENPDFFELADKVLAYSTKTPLKSSKKDLTSVYTSKLSVLLFKYGINEDKIPFLTQDIIKLFSSE